LKPNGHPFLSLIARTRASMVERRSIVMEQFAFEERRHFFAGLETANAIFDQCKGEMERIVL
jgi:hypothetical protein